MKKIIMITCVCFIIFSCGPRDKLVPLNSIAIPEYENSDYIRLLDDENPEIVYNAICNLINSSGNYGDLLSKDSINDPEIEEAKTVYNKISKLLLSDDEWIVCSSLRFFANFGNSYNEKDEIVQKLLKVKLKSKSIKIEYINTLESLYGAKPEPLKEVITNFIKNDSWFISRYSYHLIPCFNSPDLNDFLFQKYSESSEYDKLLLIRSFGQNLNDTILDYLLNELKTENSSRIKLSLAKQLGFTSNFSKVKEWLNYNSSILNDIKEPMAEYYIDNMEFLSSPQIICFLLKERSISDSLIYGTKSNFYNNLYSCLNNDNTKDEVFHKNIHEIETCVLINEKYKTHWIKYRNKQEKSMYNVGFKQKQKELIKEFELKSAKLYDDYKIDINLKNQYIDEIKRLNNEFEPDKN